MSSLGKYQPICNCPVRPLPLHTLFPLTDRYVPSATHLAPFRQYPLTRQQRNLFASPSQLSSGKLKRCIYFLSCDRMETALDMARKERACDLHHEEDRPYLVNALYASIR